MTKKSRLSPNKESQAALKSLVANRILVRDKVGLRHTLKHDGTVKYVGYDTDTLWGGCGLPNFHPGVERTYGTVVEYNGARAELTATLGRADWKGHILDVGTHFPVNHLATELLAQTCANPASGSSRTVYGDAILVTDKRMHWYFRPYNVSAEDIEEFDAMLSTPRQLIKTNGQTEIFFHVEPLPNDIILFKMRWL